LERGRRRIFGVVELVAGGEGQQFDERAGFAQPPLHRVNGLLADPEAEAAQELEA